MSTVQQGDVEGLGSYLQAKVTADLVSNAYFALDGADVAN
jgi:hypothetical protein